MAAARLLGLSLVATTGIAGLSGDAWPASLPWPPMGMHECFGVLLLSMVVMSFREGILRAPLSEAAARQLCRKLSRRVYLILYVVFGADQVVRASWNAAALQPLENRRDYFVYGLVALLSIRALAAISVRRPPAPRMNPRSAPAEGAAAPP